MTESRLPERWGRSLAPLWLFLYLIMVGVAPIADARLEAAARHATVHIEAPTDEPCAPAHDHFVCQFCRALQLNTLGVAGSPRLATGALVFARLLLASPAELPNHLLAALPDSRAPPAEIG